MGARVPRSAAQWEHKQVTLPEDADLASHVAAGWELVTVVPSQNRPGWVIAYFKRPSPVPVRPAAVQTSATPVEDPHDA
jgi:hypothetical protein